MEAAPLSLAYSHARNAVSETQKANPIAASEEHDLAAGEFANAAKSTGDLEALRTLRLLEHHHQRLAELLKYKPEIPAAIEDVLDESLGSQAGALSTVVEEAGDVTPRKTPQSSSRHASKHSSLPVDTRHHRDLSSSIASNLASARGIQPRTQRKSLASPSSPTLNTQNADGRMASTEERRDSSKRMSRGYDRRSQAPVPSQTSPYKSSPSAPHPSRISPTRSSTASIPPSIVQPGSDDAFTRFYSTVENLGTKLSAALAFTGLPLSSPTGDGGSTAQADASEKQQQPPALPRDKSRTTPSGSPDVSRFFSRAAIKAVREDGGGPGVAESFYVVPTSGGTVSYAGMLQGQRQSSGMSEVEGGGAGGGGDEEFVDASEVPVQGNFEGDGAGAGRRTRSRAGSLWKDTGARVGPKEGRDDLRCELEYWKNMAKDTGERLKAFEMNAQRESIMAASIYRGGGGPRSRPHSPESIRGHAAAASPPPVPKIPAGLKRASTATTSDSSEGPKDQKIKELEDEIERAKEEIKKCQKENRKLMAVVEKYRKRFEDLKENARERMRAQEERAKAQQAKEDDESRKDQMLD